MSLPDYSGMCIRVRAIIYATNYGPLAELSSVVKRKLMSLADVAPAPFRCRLGNASACPDCDTSLDGIRLSKNKGYINIKCKANAT